MTAFKTELSCGNCGEEWEDEHPEKTEVSPRQGITGIYVFNTECDEFRGSDCGCCYTIGCPNCKLAEHVTVEGRSPV